MMRQRHVVGLPTRRIALTLFLGMLTAQVILVCLKKDIQILRLLALKTDRCEQLEQQPSAVWINVEPELRQMRLLCLITTEPAYYELRAIHIQNTWARRCKKFWFTGTQAHKQLVLMRLELPHSTKSEFSWFEAKFALRRLYQDVESYEFYLYAPDDAYFLIENLYAQLQYHLPEEPFITGHQIRERNMNSYFMKRTGFVLSRAAIRKLVEQTLDQHPDCPDLNEKTMERRLIKCGEVFGMTQYDSLDSQGSPLFPSKSLLDMVTNLTVFKQAIHRKSLSPIWKQLGLGARQICFPHVNPLWMYIHEFVLYQLRPVGLTEAGTIGRYPKLD
ncbi:hypothetical protein EG68_00193 [Paragonimus skrjabini miyazakii]|uniref:Uncharacterized protein n=1 Tax=Paragonimus skrjabini miyazakii TaxID=59628 RepID=A0A8S9Z6K7_9TREM|nr:hypothetical protein EG68_00193 [Paragonimus skrjabini miyazakii]